MARVARGEAFERQDHQEVRGIEFGTPGRLDAHAPDLRELRRDVAEARKIECPGL